MNSKKAIITWTKALLSALEGKTDKEQIETIQRLSEILKQKKKTYLLLPILTRAEKQIKQRQRLRLSFARKMPQDFISYFSKKIIPFFDNNKTIEVAIDKNLIGGFCAQSSQLIIDGSLKTLLDQLKQSLQE